jgi:hypothetical protein
MTNGKSSEQLIQETHEKVDKLYTVLLGEPGTEEKGLCGEVKNLREDMNHFKRNFWVLVGVLSASGIGGVSLFNLLK